MQIKVYLLLVAGALALGSAQSIACSCSAEVVDTSPELEKQKWLERMAEGSDAVVLARVTYIAPYSDGAQDAGQYGVLEVLEVFKGHPSPTIEVTTGWCSNFELEVEEERVFFVTAGGRIQGCSEYRHAMSDDEVSMRLRK